MPNTYHCGANVRFEVAFKTPAGVYVDPTTVTFKIQSPEDGSVTTWVFGGAGSIVQESTGHYYADYTCDFPGDWWYRWEASGSYIGAVERRVCIMGTRF